MTSDPICNWTSVPLRDCGKWYSGGTPSTEVASYWGGDIPWITASSLHDFYIRDSVRRVTASGLENGTRLVPEGAIIFVVRGMSLKTEFRVGIAKRPVAFGQDCKAIVTRPGIEPSFLANVLRARASEILGMADEASHGTGRLQTGALSELEIPVPPLAAQKRIASILSALDDKIELNRRMNQTLEAMARAIFKSWFIDFDPVRRNADRNTPPDPQSPDALFPAQFQDSPLGPIPKGWTVSKLGDVCDINQSTIRNNEIHGEIQYVDISSVTTGHLDNATTVDFTDAPSRARRRVKHGDTIWSCVRPNRKSYLFIHTPPPEMIVSTGFAVLSPNRIGSCFLHEAVTRPEFVDYLAANADGSAYPAVRPDHFAAAELIVPPTEIMEAFEKIVWPFHDQIAANDRQSQTLAPIRDALLPKLLSGELRVKNSGNCTEHSP